MREAIKSIKNINFIYTCVACITILASNAVQSETASNNEQNIKRTNTLWSSKDTCFKEGDTSVDEAVMIAIESFGDTYKVAGCVKYGCRITVPEFGRKTYQVNFRHDPKFIWLSDTVFETVVYGKNTRFYHCMTK